MPEDAWQSNLESATDYLLEALNIALELDDDQREARILYTLAQVEMERAADVAARSYYEKVQEIAQDINDPFWRGRCESGLGSLNRNKGDERQAMKQFQTALAFARESEDREGQAQALWDLGRGYVWQLQELSQAPMLLVKPVEPSVATAVDGRKQQALALRRRAEEHLIRAEFLYTQAGMTVEVEQVAAELAELKNLSIVTHEGEDGQDTAVFPTLYSLADYALRWDTQKR
jgi:tetratricopeptide (TPR) repeat protein